MNRTIPLLALLAAIPAAAQAPAYARGPADTLRYRNSWQSRTEAQGPHPASAHANQVTFALTFPAADSARALQGEVTFIRQGRAQCHRQTFSYSGSTALLSGPREQNRH